MKAIELAVILHDKYGAWHPDVPESIAVAELRRLAEVNAELLEELVVARKTIADFQSALTGAFFQEQIDSMDVIIAKAKEQQ